VKELETLQKAHNQLQRRLVTEETASQTTNSKIEELQGALKDAKDALKRETERVAKVEKTVGDLKDKNEDLQKELDDLVKEDTGRNGEVSLRFRQCRILITDPVRTKSDKEIRALKSEIKGLKSVVNTKEADLEEAQEELEKIRNETREKDKAIRKESREKEALKDQLANLQVRVA
jgi:predicted  nucleic acid-binding Zn-ribbon protein